ncbi:MAG: hypothetical protein WAO76_16455 [Georgfuchsia sp.]
MRSAFCDKARRDYSLMNSMTSACDAAPCLGNTFKDTAYCLTEIDISNKLTMMNGELDSLEQKIEQVLAMCAQLRSENHVLRDRMVEFEQLNQTLVSRAETARTRLEALLDKFPAE